ncbi:NACHT, LRR and PYD domains-containing protein 1b allele 3-like [Oreochromis aureus]|uniref:NACHT, LRR and PYD domains-containing protein 1b allele 3-like n=1 Tax=Oreochromis aureus TaxID=47969 RepID=UPI001954C083|nr:NACHT, LRR and PYD domains-containing protein 1b allele 3-like [Oreochromis aureus]
MKRRQKHPYFDAGDALLKKKKMLNGQTAVPINTQSNSQTVNGKESLEEIKHTGAITYNAMVQNKDRRQSLSTTQRRTDLTQATCSPDMKPKRSFEEFTPIIAADDSDDETYLFQCSSAGLYQCSVTGLVFVMKGEGDVVYRTVPWNRKLLDKHHKKPAGPLFDIKCQQQSVCQLHLPHCELISTAGGQSLKVAHVNDETIEFILPHQITESHVVINITGFSGYGNVKDEDSPPGPVQAMVLLFYKPPEELNFRSFLNVLLLPRNIVVHDVKNKRRELVGEEMYIDVPSKCILHPKQVYSLSTVPDDDLINIQPYEAEFDEEYPNYSITTFQVILKTIITDINLSVTHQSSSSCVWEREVCLLPNRVRSMISSPNKRLLNVRSSFIDRISGPVLSSLMDKLLEKGVMVDGDREEADAMQSRSDRARFVIDTVRRKGEAASSQMIEFLRELDAFLHRNLFLI